MVPWTYHFEEDAVRSRGKIRMTKNWMVMLILTGTAVFSPGLRAQAPEPPPPAAGNEQAAATAPLPVIKTESRIVLVDAVVTDKRGNYIRDLQQQEFRVYEDNKEQVITSFSFGSDPGVQEKGQKRYMVLFFDNSSMDKADQIQARKAAGTFIEKSAGPEHLMAIAEFGGSLMIKQNFTANAELLKAAVSGVQTPYLETNPDNTQSAMVASAGSFSLNNAASDLGVRSMLLAIRSLAKGLRAVPGRKMLVLFSAGFPLDAERMSELTATIDACNKANIAVYALDVRGLVAGVPGGSAQLKQRGGSSQTQTAVVREVGRSREPRLLLASYTLASSPEPQKPGGGGGGGTGTSGSSGPAGGTGAGGGKGGTGSGTGGGTTGGGGKGGSGGTTGSTNNNNYG